MKERERERERERDTYLRFTSRHSGPPLQTPGSYNATTFQVLLLAQKLVDYLCAGFLEEPRVHVCIYIRGVVSVRDRDRDRETESPRDRRDIYTHVYT